MTLRDFALEKNIDIDDLLKIFEMLGFKDFDENYVLSEEEIELLKEKIEVLLNGNGSSSGGSMYTGGTGGGSDYTSSKKSLPNSDSDSLGNDNNLSAKDSFLSQIDYEAEDVYYADENIKKVSTSFDEMSTAFDGVNISSTEVSLEPLNSSKSTINNVKSNVIDKLKTNIGTIKSLIASYDENAYLLFNELDAANNENPYGDISDTENTDNENDDTAFEELPDEELDIVDDTNKDATVPTNDTTTETPNIEDDSSLEQNDSIPSSEDVVPDLVTPIDDELTDNSASESSNLQPKNNSTISHRGYNTGSGIGWNILEHFENAGKQGYWGCEADVRFNSNGELVCSHNPVQTGENPPLFSDYLDVCKDYGMTAIIDLKYSYGWTDMDELSPKVIEIIREKDMFDSCIIQTFAAKDIPQIRALSDEARIWFLTDSISDSNMDIIKNYNVEGVNINNANVSNYQINKLLDNDIDICVWNVFSEQRKEMLLNMGVKYVMTDNELDVTPYQAGEEDFNNLN